MPSAQEQAQWLRMLWGGFWSSRIIITANNLQIFDHLTEPKDAPALAELIKSDPRATEVLLHALVALQLLKKHQGRFRNASLSTRFLVSGTPHYQGDILKHADNLWNSWSQLDNVVKTGKPASKTTFDHHAFIMGMHNIAHLVAPEVVRSIGMQGVAKAMDLGGGPGTYAMEMRRQGAASVTHFDLPDTTNVAKRLTKQAGIDGILFKSGDVLQDKLGAGYDLVLLSQLIHAFSAEQTQMIFEKVCQALRPGGRVVVQDFALNPNLTSPTQGALFSVNMLVNTPGGRCYPAQEIRALLKQAGFVRASSRMAAGNSLTIAFRPHTRS
ncbi:MAG: methyltransferase [Trichlorobacter sp.]|jgi:2-polyprenyl-3-methyl-5-hydroxy-6-metoxy-1,4-benzoquinol methylase